MKYTAVIFDLDGVICHTDKFHYLAWKHIADEIGVNFDKQINNRLRGVSRAESFDIILENFDGMLNEQEKLNYLNRKNQIYRDYLKTMTPDDISEDVWQTLIKIKEKGLRIAIGSSSRNARLIIKQTGLEPMFDAISDGTNIQHSKPHPEVFLKAAQYLSTDAASCLVVEDAESGIKAALAANMDCAAIGDATNYNTATYNIFNLYELIAILEQ